MVGAMHSFKLLATLSALVIFASPATSQSQAPPPAMPPPLASSPPPASSVPAYCMEPQRSSPLTIPLTAANVNWGYWYSGSNPKAYVKSGEIFTMEMGTHLSGDAPELMIKGDPGVESVYKWTSAGQAISMRGASGKADGKHTLTGPVYVCGAEPGDVIQMEILDMKPRKNPTNGKAWGSNGASSWGMEYKTGFNEGTKRDVATIYEVVTDADGYALYATPEYQFKLTADAALNYTGQQTPTCVLTTGETPDTAPGRNYTWNSPAQVFSKYSAPCINGSYNLMAGYWYAGVMYNHSTPLGTEDYSVKGKWRVPANPHVGNMGLASNWPVPVSSTYPTRTAGNLDNKKVGAGSSLYAPVEVEGGLFQAGDCHTVQGDSEYDGTALETPYTAQFRLTVHKAAKLPYFIPTPFEAPILETVNEMCWHAFTFNDYLRDIPLLYNGTDAQSNIGKLGFNVTKMIIQTGATGTRGIMKYFNVTEDIAHSIQTLACDTGISQLVNSNIGGYTCCFKYVGQPVDGKNLNDKLYLPQTTPDAIKPAKPMPAPVVKAKPPPVLKANSPPPAPKKSPVIHHAAPPPPKVKHDVGPKPSTPKRKPIVHRPSKKRQGLRL